MSTARRFSRNPNVEYRSPSSTSGSPPINMRLGRDGPEYQRRVVIYARTNISSRTMDSLREQEWRIRKHLSDIGVDHGDALVVTETSSRGRRIELERLMQLVDAGVVATVAVDERSRISRQPSEFWKLVETLSSRNVSLIVADDALDRANEDSRRALEVAMRQLEWQRLQGHRVRRGAIARLARGSGYTGRLPFGFRVETDGAMHPASSRPAIAPNEAAIVQLVFRLFTYGRWSIKRIARHLNQRHRANPVFPGKKGRKGWSSQTVTFMLRNETYRGVWRWGRRQTIHDPKRGRMRVMLEDWRDHQISRRPDLRIVSLRTWRLAHRRLRLVRRRYFNARPCA